jgi:hypothetical protein
MMGGWHHRRPRQPVTITDEEREVLERWSRRPKSPHSIAQRARIVLLAADSLPNTVVAERVGVNQATVVKWRKRFLAASRGVDRRTPAGRPPVDLRRRRRGGCGAHARGDPGRATHWSTRDLAKKVGMSPRRSGGSGRRSASSRGAPTASSSRPKAPTRNAPASKRIVSDSHKAAMAKGREESRAVSADLGALEAHRLKRGRRRTPESIRARLDGSLIRLRPLVVP